MPDSSLTYDDSRLQQFYAALAPRERRRALKGALAASARMVRKEVINQMRTATGFRSNPVLERGVRAIVYKQVAGFRVTVGTKINRKDASKSRGFYVNSQWRKRAAKRTDGYARAMPILVWADIGTADRHTRRNKAYRGRLQRYGFIAKTADRVEGQVTDYLHGQIIKYVTKTAQKYGATAL